jgi:hypothetical protein
MPASTSVPWTASTSSTTRGAGAAPEITAFRRNELTQDLYVSDALKTGASWSRTRTSACTAVCVPSAAPPVPGTCRNSSTRLPRRERHAPDKLSQRFRHSSSPTSTARAPPVPTTCSPRRSTAWAFRSARRTSFPSNIQGLPTWYEVRVSDAAIWGVAVASTSWSRSTRRAWKRTCGGGAGRLFRVRQHQAAGSATCTATTSTSSVSAHRDLPREYRIRASASCSRT